ncbi:hypothetical protein AMTR_s00051p00091410 [Amborella trichopoda]|uniref:Uncharacterized protein n=1 Tax=Amborella trichopoda TaxID=13333 RepID=U5D2J1_AMBTC|nr:hypothetical protein AMTR_s00051p00091410 [Amborella trichopoda]
MVLAVVAHPLLSRKEVCFSPPPSQPPALLASPASADGILVLEVRKGSTTQWDSQLLKALHFRRFKGVLMTVERWSIEANLSLFKPPSVSVKVLSIPIHSWTKEIFVLVTQACSNLVEIDWFTSAGPSMGSLRMKVWLIPDRNIPDHFVESG